VLLLALSVGCGNVTWIRRGGWAKYTPTPVLIGMEWVLPTPEAVWGELSRRRKQMGVQSGAMMDALAVRALGDDSKRWNAEWAISLLSGREDAVERLERALLDDDLQRRQIAAMVLRRRYSGSKFDKERLDPGAPSERLLEVSVEALRNDALRAADTLWSGNGIDAFQFLLDHAERSGPLLERACGSNDVQQACLAAAVLGFSRQTRYADVCVPVLMRNLGEDSLDGNTRLALPAIIGFGERALVHLRLADPQDGQERGLIRVLCRALEGQALEPEDLWIIRSVTSVYRDPREALKMPWRLCDGLYF
jgi:hypothetical protein